MRRMIAPLALLAATSLLAAAPAAMAGDRDGDGWDRPSCACDCGCAHSQDIHLPDSFFYDAGGAGPAYVDYGGSSGGEIVLFESGRTSVNASASAQAQASAHAFAFARVQARQGMMRPHRSYGHGW